MLWILLATGLVVAAQPEEAEQTDKTPDWAIVAKRHASACRVSPLADEEHPFAMVPEAVLHRAQEVRGSSRGSTFLWLEPSGRPAVILDVYLFKKGADQYQVGNEWHSLTEASIEAEWSERSLLRTTSPGLEWTAVPEAPAVAEKLLSRQRQARQLAERFTSHLIQRNQDRYELRLLTTPLLQYETTDFEPSRGGALFAFCQQTDPEVLILIEARKSGDSYRWEYAVAGFTNMDVYVQLDGNEVWRDAPAFTRGRGVHSGGQVRLVNIAAELEAAKQSP